MMLAASNGERITVMLEGVSEAVEKGTTAQKLVAMHGINATTIYVNNRPAWPNHHLRNGDVVNCRKTKES